MKTSNFEILHDDHIKCSGCSDFFSTCLRPDVDELETFCSYCYHAKNGMEKWQDVFDSLNPFMQYCWENAVKDIPEDRYQEFQALGMFINNTRPQPTGGETK